MVRLRPSDIANRKLLVDENNVVGFDQLVGAVLVTFKKILEHWQCSFVSKLVS